MCTLYEPMTEEQLAADRESKKALQAKALLLFDLRDLERFEEDRAFHVSAVGRILTKADVEAAMVLAARQGDK